MFVYKDEYNTKEFRNALRRLENAIKDINDMGFVFFVVEALISTEKKTHTIFQMKILLQL